ncbi:MAG: WG repeat-containing protein [Candidatus Spyradocola sp.]|jgi:hypothetical protein
MKLEQFKEIADENLRDLYVDERMVSSIRRKLCAVPVQRKSRVPRASALLAAACAVVMLLSGGVLLYGSGAVRPLASAMPSAAPAVPHNSAMSTLSSSVETSQSIDGSTLSYGVEEVGTFCEEGYAPARGTNGLYGYVNRDNVWVVPAMYDDAEEVVEGKAAVTVQGTVQIIDVP